jgi:hypothetical protein
VPNGTTDSVRTSAAARIPRNKGDLPGYLLTAVDKAFDSVYGDHVHQNDGTHLHNNNKRGDEFTNYWKRLIPYPPKQYKLPRGKVGRLFVETLSKEVDLLTMDKEDSERIIVFILVILQRTKTVTKAADIRARIELRLNNWLDGKYKMLVETAERDMAASLKSVQMNMNSEQRNKIFNMKLLKGEVRAAVRFLCDNNKGGILLPDDITEDKINGVQVPRTVMAVLQDKHPEARPPTKDDLHVFDDTPDLASTIISEDVIEKVAKNLTGGAGLGGAEGASLRDWLTMHKKASKDLQHSLAKLATRLQNELVPWPTIRALRAGRLIALDKQPGVRPIGIGDTLYRLLAKSSLVVCKEEAKEVCGIDQLAAGLESGIEGAIHAMNDLWDQCNQEESFGYLLIDARNAFNEQNRTMMLWNTRHLCPMLALFAFNVYKHHSILHIRSLDGDPGAVLHSREGVTQGDPLSMVLYGVGMLPLIKQLKELYPTLYQPWYADDAAAVGQFEDILLMFNSLIDLGRKYGYFPEQSKSIIIVSEKNFDKAKEFFVGFKVTTGSRYLGGFIGETTAKEEWIDSLVEEWIKDVESLSIAAIDFPQAAYAAFQKSKQMEWQYVQRVVRGLQNSFDSLTDSIYNRFISTLFALRFPDTDQRVHLFPLPIKNGGIAIPKPSTTSEINYNASRRATQYLIDTSLDKQNSFDSRITQFFPRKQRMTSSEKRFAGMKMKQRGSSHSSPNFREEP